MPPPAAHRVAALLALTALAACTRRDLRPPPFPAVTVLGGETYTRAQLARGWSAYTAQCRPCHGDRGDGKGVAAFALWPAPRDLTAAQFEFVSEPAGALPQDADLARIVRDGLAGTAMRPWDVPEPELSDVIGYVKWLGHARWAAGRPGTPLVIDPAAPPAHLLLSDPNHPAPAPARDPWEPDEAHPRWVAGTDGDAVARGEAIYVRAGCASCHATYVSRPRLYEILAGAPGSGAADFIDVFAGLPPSQVAGLVNAPYAPTPRWSDVFGENLVPPDFLRDPIRSATGHLRSDGTVDEGPIEDVWPYPILLVARPFDVFRVLVAGLNGAAMPSYEGVLPGGDKDLWALAHYVAHLARLRGTPAAAALEARRARWAHSRFVPPTPAPRGPASCQTRTSR